MQYIIKYVQCCCEKLKTLVAIPAYNEETSIGSVVLKARQHADKVIVVDDGSMDHTAEIAELAGAEVIRHLKNSGYGAALKTCFAAAQKNDAEVLIILDADGQHDPAHLKSVSAPILSGEADIVIGSRFLETPKNIPKYRVFGMKVLDKLTSISSNHNGGKVSDSQSGFRAYSKKAYVSIDPRSKGMGAGSEILIDAQEKNLRIKEVPIIVRYDVGKHSDNPVTHGARVVMTIVRTISQRRPLLFFGATGSAMLIGGFVTGWHTMELYNPNKPFPTGTALITVIFLITGAFTLLTGIILYSLEDTIQRIVKKTR
jgi:glycosyltransferase involved in cell wall biosynthesis